ncbi:hypothetical protein CP8484711_1852B, partial [Chlamydia psittaci 84-8471/1]
GRSFCVGKPKKRLKNSSLK